MTSPPATEACLTDGRELSYTTKASLMGAPYEFRIGPEALHYRIGRHTGIVAYAAISRIRLSYRPLSNQTRRYLIEISSPGTPRLAIPSTSVRGLLSQDRQDTEYVAFVRRLHARLSGRNAHAELLAGSPPYLYWPALVMFAGLVAGLPLALGRAFWTGATGAAALLTFFFGYFIWQLGMFFWRNRPGTYTVDELPERVLPRV
jgi:hypothetical protein